MMKSRILMPVVLAGLMICCPSLAADEPLMFTPQSGFGGESKGDGSLRLLLGKARPFHVKSHGREQSDGTFRLEQRITFQGKQPRDRVWIITTVGANRYSGTLSDAAGPVTGYTIGARLFFQYRLKGLLVMHQELELLPGGKTIDNVGSITFLGIPVGRLRERISL